MARNLNLNNFLKVYVLLL